MNILHKLESRMIHPPVQAALILGISLAIMLIGWAFGAMGWGGTDKLFAWSIATALLLVFAMANSLFSIKAANFAQYWGRSMYSYIGLALANTFAAKVFSGVPMADAGSYRWIVIVVTVGFIVFLSLVNFVKRIVNFAEREEWNQPRKRR